MKRPPGLHAGSVYDSRRRTGIADGTWLYQVPAGEVQAHVDALIEQGMSYQRIAAAAGVTERTVRGMRGRSYVRGATAKAILAVNAAPKPLRADLVPGVGTRRRVQALAAIGWPLTVQARRMGATTQQVWEFAHVDRPVSAVNHRRAEALFESLSATPGPSSRVRRMAAERGWVPPLAWDDIDDPDGLPDLEGEPDGEVDEVAVARASRGERLALTPEEKAEALRLGVDRGEPLSRVSARLGVNYADARKMLGVDLSPRRAQQIRVEAELARVGDVHNDFTIAALTGVHHQTVTRARARLARRQNQLAS